MTWSGVGVGHQEMGWKRENEKCTGQEKSSKREDGVMLES